MFGSREWRVREMVKMVYNRNMCRELFRSAGAPEPSNGAIDRCVSAALQVGLATVDSPDERTNVVAIDSAFDAAVRSEVVEYRRMWEVLAA